MSSDTSDDGVCMTNTPTFASMVAARHAAFPTAARAASYDPSWIAFDVANTRVVLAHGPDDYKANDPRRIGTFAGADGQIWAILHHPIPREG